MNLLYRRGTAFSGQERVSSRLRVALCAALAVFSLTATLAHSATLSEDDLLLLDMVLERERIASSVTAYSHGSSAFMSLAEVGGALQFPIVVEAKSGTASGSIIHPDRTFELNVAAQYVDIQGVRKRFDADDVVVHGDAIFVRLEVLSQWFPVDLQLNKASLSVSIQPREPLPAQIRNARRSSALLEKTIGPAVLPPIDNAYRLIGLPAADVGLGYWTRRNRKTATSSTGLNYSALVSGDVAFMDARVYLGGSHTDALTNLRASLSRDNLGMPLGLRYVEIGDIVPAIVPGMNYNGVERGVLVQGGGSVAGRDDLIDSNLINISGDALEGWDVELFQAGMRVGFQTVGANGRYNFQNIEPLAGENIFELVFHGPSGERRTETLTRYSGLLPDQPGSVRYQLSVSQKGEPLYKSDELTYDDVSDAGSTRIAAGMEVRVLPQLAVRGSWNSAKIDGKQLDYTSLGFRAGWRDLTLSVDGTRDPEGETRWEGALQLPASMRVAGFDTRFSYTQFAESVRRETAVGVDDYELRLRSRAGVTVSGPIGPIASKFSYYRNQEVDGRNSNSLSAGFTVRADKLIFGNTLSYYRFNASEDGVKDPDQLRGNLFFSTRFHPLSVRGGLSYMLRPDTKAQQYFLDSNLAIARDMSMTFGLTHSPLTGLTRYISGFNWHLPSLTLSPRITYDSDGEYSGFVYASFSMAPRPDRSGVMFSGRSLATSGGAAARVFMDNDANGVFSEGDQPLPNVKVRAPQAYGSADTDKSGVAYLTPLSTARPTDVVLDASTLPDVQSRSINAGNSVHPRPTSMPVVDFPVRPTGDIDGRVLLSAAGRRTPVAGAMVELHDPNGKVVDFKVSAHDGFFEFSGIPYGTYSLELKGSQRSNANAPMVVIARERKAHTNVDIVISRVESNAPTLAPVVSTPSALPAPRSDDQASAHDRGLAALPSSTPVRQPSPQLRAAANPSGGRVVQLGVFSSSEGARTHRQDLIERGLLTSEQIEVVPVDLGVRGVMHRVVADPGGLSAESLCKTLKARGTQCFTITL